MRVISAGSTSSSSPGKICLLFIEMYPTLVPCLQSTGRHPQILVHTHFRRGSIFKAFLCCRYSAFTQFNCCLLLEDYIPSIGFEFRLLASTLTSIYVIPCFGVQAYFVDEISLMTLSGYFIVSSRAQKAKKLRGT